MNAFETALALLELGHRPIPVTTKAKKPFGKAWQNRQWTADQLRDHYSRYPQANIGVLLGPESGIIDLEFDGPESEQVFNMLFPNLPPTVSYYSNRSLHRLFRWNPLLSGCGNVVCLNANGKRAEKGEPHVEARVGGGDGCQSLLPPSVVKGDVRLREYINDWSHPLADLADEIARMLAAAVEPKAAPIVSIVSQESEIGDRPGDDFNRRATWSEILEPHGWKMVGESEGVRYWRRPGKTDDGHSATTGHCKSTRGEDKFYCFSSNAAPFKANRSYSKFACFTELNHSGDYSAATKTLAAQGYGAPSLWQAEGRTDSANAKRLTWKCGDQIRWCDAWDSWLVWDSRRWAADETCRIEALAKQCAKSMWLDAARVVANQDASDAVKKAAMSHVKTANSAAGIGNMIRLARSEPGIAVTSDVLDTNGYLLNVENGTIDLRTGKLRPHDRSDFITKLVPVEFDPSAKCPLFSQFLQKIFAGNQNLIGFLNRLLGYCLTGDVSEEVIAIFHGGGANGKSTLINVMLTLLDSYAGKAAPQLLAARKFESHPTELAALFGLRLAVCNETESGAKFAEARVKELTSREPIKARGMREDFWDFTPSHKLVVCTNHKPVIRGTDHAIWRRLKLVPFNVTISDTEKDKHFGDKRKAELPGILAWLVQGCLAWQHEGLAAPPEVEMATQQYRQSQDSFANFMAECCEVGAELTAGATPLLKAYKAFTGESDISAKELSNLLSDKGFANCRITSGPDKGKKEWIGLALAV